MKKILIAIRNLVGNNLKTSIGIALIVIILLYASCVKANPHIIVSTAVSFGKGSLGAVLGLDLEFPQSDNINIFGGTTLWGKTDVADNNWDFHVGYEACKKIICAAIGAAYLQRIDALNGSHAEYYLRLSHKFDWGRLHDARAFHLSNAGTELPNHGRNAAGPSWKLQ